MAGCRVLKPPDPAKGFLQDSAAIYALLQRNGLRSENGLKGLASPRHTQRNTANAYTSEIALAA